MEIREVEAVFAEEFRRAVEENLGRRPEQVALDGKVPQAREVATAVKYLQRARTKLPSYYAVRAFLPPLAFEQSSSEECAAHKEYSGGVAVDMTCGLGVDSYYLSKRFEKVVAVERDAALAEVARRNFALLGADNIEVVNCSAEEYAAGMEAADLIYADPDRRGAGDKKLVLLSDCSPDIQALLPILSKRAPKIAVKLSPMFDAAEAFRVFGEHTTVEAVSLGGECKELLVTVSENIAEPTLKATAIGAGSFEAACPPPPTKEPKPFEPHYGYLVVPDAALRKLRLAEAWCASKGVDCYGEWGFCDNVPAGLIGRAAAIDAVMPFKPKALKALMGKSIGIIRHGFPLSSAEICRALGVREGAGPTWAFAEIERKLWAIRLK